MSWKEAPTSGDNPSTTGSPSAALAGQQQGTEGEFWEFRLYVAGKTQRADSALANLTAACESYLHGRYHIEVIDLLLDPKRARDDQIVALPTLVRRLPHPLKKLIGDLSQIERVLVGLELKQRGGR